MVATRQCIDQSKQLASCFCLFCLYLIYLKLRIFHTNQWLLITVDFGLLFCSREFKRVAQNVVVNEDGLQTETSCHKHCLTISSVAFALKYSSSEKVVSCEGLRSPASPGLHLRLGAEWRKQPCGQSVNQIIWSRLNKVPEMAFLRNCCHSWLSRIQSSSVPSLFDSSRLHW